MSEDKSKLQLIGEIAQANNKNLELIEELNDRENEIERLNKELEQEKKDFKEVNDKCFELLLENKRLNNIINDLLNRQNEALRYIGNHLSLDSRYKHGNGDKELTLVKNILNKHIKELKGSE